MVEKTFEELITEPEFKVGATQEEQARLKAKMDFDYPPSYLEFLARHNGGGGWLGRGWFSLYSVADALDINALWVKDADYEEHFINYYWLIGSNGSLFTYAIEKETGHFVELDVFDDEYAVYLGKSFQEFLNFLHKLSFERYDEDED
ncbi:SMI1/KNR4 family protein [Hymenobacter profundi]|uniref:SMI1/KNR4 family protein n=1 Tax=Hymenobacter profundi TaxID=1982110 RepID=A0ABS6X4M3_9BACT|nr:SMI1/KNR4 family protein [Hymenobacter profundi]MBW3130675.1 SMI1/KNR4 family protein [Hymenobacter profundi]